MCSKEVYIVQELTAFKSLFTDKTESEVRLQKSLLPYSMQTAAACYLDMEL
jgi:hypothetical protein